MAYYRTVTKKCTKCGRELGSYHELVEVGGDITETVDGCYLCPRQPEPEPEKKKRRND